MGASVCLDHGLRRLAMALERARAAHRRLRSSSATVSPQAVLGARIYAVDELGVIAADLAAALDWLRAAAADARHGEAA